jgi:pantoate--beta-alanine ligase
MHELRIVAEVDAVRRQVLDWRAEGGRIALVPTMGNLHDGHLSLVRLAREQARRVVVSVFVNPSQFGPGEDLEAYPRTPDEDRAALEGEGADLLFMPTPEAIYPFGVEAMTRVSVPGLSAVLCGASRPGHFDGVTTVVCRLLNIVQPDIAVFGQKDYQQLLIVQRMVTDLHLPVRIQAAPIQREADGLAMSSRNRYLQGDDRARAPAIHAALRKTVRAIGQGRRDFATLEAEGAAELMAAGMRADYFAVRRAADLGAPDSMATRLVVLAAAYCGPARLIDNVLVDI